ncbi:MCP four helix bundle domain-containing protein [Pontibacter anaerobius]|uniref:MCP four helix bundle domain-containing protein n=1 Tax=Pontibacter anaerobius TaxID=2993940 RepID=A0ABT3RJ44_9BACT|nr:MCP four helix bundle domain-containing protein [Pontibacter anaerobius]MCX2741878.1 MCP four helix bundle domain-containing protein [Pontibacter anaerobius]
MTWSFRIGNRNRIALALGFVFLLILLANWLVSYNMTKVSSQFKSVYADRLVPALDISAMQERYYQNRLLLEEHLLTDAQEEEQRIMQAIEQNEVELDSLLRKFQATYLTKQETKDLDMYRQAARQYAKAQQTILVMSHTGDKGAALKLFRKEGMAAFQEVLQPLHALSHLQEQVGQELYANAERQMNSLKVISYLVIALAIILALLVGSLLQTSRQLKSIKPQKYHLN